MLAAILLTVSSQAAAPPAEPPSPGRVVIDLTPKRCTDRTGQDQADVVVCAKRERPYRIDPNVLAGQRARDALPVDTRTAQERAVEGSCHDQPSKCQGGGVIPILPAAIKTVEAVVLAVEGEDWRQPFRTKPDEYEAYRATQERERSRVSVSVRASSAAGSGPHP